MIDDTNICAHCLEREVADDDELREHELCERCFREINDCDDLKWAWRKGE